MKNISRYILYSFILLVIAGGVLLFIFNDQAAIYLQNESGLTDESLRPTVAAKPVPIGETIDATVLTAPLLKTLVNYVVNFNFDNVCWRPDTVLSRPADLVVATSTTATSTAAANTPIKCAPGNGLPFLVNKNKK
ncbi:MAG: hypothetical protein WC249_04395 [Patescibacteria group bacterium]|jgi:hypothetical protein